MKGLDYELFVARTILEAAEDAYLNDIALERLFLAVERIAKAHKKAAEGRLQKAVGLAGG